MNILSSNYLRLLLALHALMLGGCKQYLEVYPNTQLPGSSIFKTADGAEAAVAGLYDYINSSELLSGYNIAYVSGLSSDELINYYNDINRQQLNDNNLLPENTRTIAMWAAYYQLIYRCNSLLEGLKERSELPVGVANRLNGEVYFMRAYSYFYLVNFYGEVPLAISSDYRVNALLPKSAIASVYGQIIQDLKIAEQLLPADDASGQRIRVNRWTALALMARVCLYAGQPEDALQAASQVIDQAGTFRLETDLVNVFTTNSSETIWQLAYYNGNTPANTPFGRSFIVSGEPTMSALREEWLRVFTPGDGRMSAWIGLAQGTGGAQYHYPYKYKATALTPVTEHSVLLRLSEQYLIRAEALAMTGQAGLAWADVATIRNRAGISDADKPIGRDALQRFIIEERQRELFCEDAHRWFDLKRTNTAQEILAPLKPQWKPTAVLFPIPESQLLNDPSMHNAQNVGY